MSPPCSIVNECRYDCSHPDLDRLVHVCCENGALGARLTGAGWGGCVVSLVECDKAAQFLDAVWDQYYQSHKVRRKAVRSDVLFATAAGPGGSVLKL